MFFVSIETFFRKAATLESFVAINLCFYFKRFSYFSFQKCEALFDGYGQYLEAYAQRRYAANEGDWNCE